MSSSKFLRILSSVRGGLRPILIATFTSLAPITFSASAADENREDGAVRVMTRNLYLGSSLEGLLKARSLTELIAAAAQVTQNITDSKPDERAAAVAREIVKNHVDLVGLQEATIEIWAQVPLRDDAPPPPSGTALLTACPSRSRQPLRRQSRAPSRQPRQLGLQLSISMIAAIQSRARSRYGRKA
jgi:hypothetical protein